MKDNQFQNIHSEDSKKRKEKRLLSCLLFFRNYVASLKPWPVKVTLLVCRSFLFLFLPNSNLRKSTLLGLSSLLSLSTRVHGNKLKMHRSWKQIFIPAPRLMMTRLHHSSHHDHLYTPLLTELWSLWWRSRSETLWGNHSVYQPAPAVDLSRFH